MMITVILDTSFILTALEDGIDIRDELKRILEEKYSMAIMEGTLKELKGKKQENVARLMLEKGKIAIIPASAEQSVDASILEQASKETIVATQDKRLKEKLKKRGSRILTIRQKKYVVMV